VPPTPEEAKRRAKIKYIYVGLVGWVWMAAAVATFYFLVSAIFLGGSWWHCLASAAVAWLFYRVALYYQLETERSLREAVKTEAGGPT
jgi:cytosine/uracil/thiamine/allantoin permease